MSIMSWMMSRNDMKISANDDRIRVIQEVILRFQSYSRITFCSMSIASIATASFVLPVPRMGVSGNEVDA